MCGIAGKFNFATNEPVSPDLVKKMTDLIHHRGPDDSGVYTDNSLGFGHRRLSILDLSEKGRQPMTTADGQLCITYNGEIYNYRKLRKELIEKNYRFTSNTDTEVILYLYREYGEECLSYLRGMFAFAIWDREQASLFMARDRIGKKPLFYYHDGKTLIFGSEIKSILADPFVKREINYQGFYDYFKYLYVPDPKTIYKNIHKLEPGHYLNCSKAGIKTTQYWDVSFSNIENASLENISAGLLDKLEESVRLRLVSDVPLGAFLSGGLDSSGVVALMSRLQETPVTTCSIGFDSKKYDEIPFARMVSKKFGTDHHEFTVKNNAEAILATLTDSFDEPFADASAVPTYYVSKLARQKVTVALSGDGGDENFAGYEKYYMDDIENRLRSFIPGSLRRSLFPFISGACSKSDNKYIQKASTLLNTLGFESDFGYYLTNTEIKDTLWSQLINSETRRNIGDYNPFSVTQRHYEKADTDHHLSRVLYTDLKTYLPGDILVKVDRMSMANSLEVRAPILDHELIEYAAKIPIQLKYSRGIKKKILKKSFETILPSDVIYRKKMGFSVPLNEWFRGELRTLTTELFFSKGAGLSHFFNMGVIKNLWEEHQCRKRSYGAVLWSMLMFELWFRQAFGLQDRGNDLIL